MDWLQYLKEPITKLDVLSGLIGFCGYKIFEIIIIIYKNSKRK
jgi:hypothetical protein